MQLAVAGGMSKRTRKLPLALSFSMMLPLAVAACAQAGATEDDATSGRVSQDTAGGAQCRTGEIVAMERPRVAADPSSGTFTYRVRFRKPARPDLPTVVHIPGGPGSTSIAEDSPAWVPPEYGLIETDPRGVGCNEVAVEDPTSFFRSEEMALDVVDAIRQVGLTRYVIHGHSYGTLLATRVAHQLAASDLPRPAAVVLEGVLGRSFDAGGASQSYVDAWTLESARLPDSVRAALREPRPLGFDGKTWGQFFMVMTSQFGAEATHAAFMLLAPAAGGAPDPARVERLRGAVATFGTIQPVSPAGIALQRYVACREITDEVPADNIDVVLHDGAFIPAPDRGTLCERLTVTEPFHTRDHLYPFPTYYFLGENDTATPPWQGKLHFDTLLSADRTEVVVKGAGHLSMMSNLSACAPELLRRSYEGSGFDAALAACNVPVESRSARAAR